MQNYITFGYAIIFLSSFLNDAQWQGFADSEYCSRISKVQIRWREFYEFYLGTNITTNKIHEEGQYYQSIKAALNDCCPKMDLEFIKENSTKGVDIELLTLMAIFNQTNSTRIPPRPFVFYFPEFATYKEKIVYDFELNFVKLSRSPGQALVMLKPSSKSQISLLEIFKGSTPMLLFMLAMSWFIGILGWLSDHWKNPEEFPSPFILGMFEGFWWAVVTMTTVGYGDKAPKSVPARVLAVVWVMISAVFLSLFTANATSILDQSLKDEDYTKTVGLKIGTFQSKEFDEFQLNMGAEVINFISYYDMDKALEGKKIDRFLFPNYKDLIWLFNYVYPEAKESRKIAKVFESPFEIGMVLAIAPEFIDPNDNFFLKCLRTGISYREKAVKQHLNYGALTFPKLDDDEGATALNNDSLLTLTLYMLAVIGCLACCGMVWDLWKFHSRRKTNINNTEEDKDVEPGQENAAVVMENLEPGVEGKASVNVKQDATWF